MRSNHIVASSVASIHNNHKAMLLAAAVVGCVAGSASAAAPRERQFRWSPMPDTGLSLAGPRLAVGSHPIAAASHGGDPGDPANTVTAFSPVLTGTARRVDVTGTITSVIAGTWPSEAVVLPIGGTALSTPQNPLLYNAGSGGFVTAPVNISYWIIGGMSPGQSLTYEHIDTFDDGAGADATTTTTHSFDDSYGPNAVEFNGNLSGASPTFNRLSSPTTLSGLGTAVPYSVQPFHVPTSGMYTLLNGASFDSYLNLFQNTFTPGSTAGGLAVADENANILRNASFSPIDPIEGSGGVFGAVVNLTAGTQYFWVTTTFLNPPDTALNNGNFTNVILGPGQATLGIVPEPASLGLLGLAGIALFRRTRRSSRSA
jgi:hypothetical protein